MAQRNGRRMIGHGGSINGFNAWLNTFPNDELTIVLLTNTNGASKATSPQLVDAVFAAAQGQGAGAGYDAIICGGTIVDGSGLQGRSASPWARSQTAHRAWM